MKKVVFVGRRIGIKSHAREGEQQYSRVAQLVVASVC